MVWDWVSGNKEELDAILRIQKNWRKGRRMKLLQRHPYKKHVTPDGTFFYSKRDDPSQVTWCAPHVPDRHGLPIAFRDEAAMKALAAANAEYQKNRAQEKAKRQVFIDIIKEKHAVGKRRRDEEAARAARALFDKPLGRRVRSSGAPRTPRVAVLYFDPARADGPYAIDATSLHQTRSGWHPFFILSV